MTALRFLGAWRWRQTCGIGLAAGIFLLLAGAARASRPSYDASLEFGRDLQADYAARRGLAIIERLDSDALRQVTFAAFGRETAESPEIRQLWTDVLLPTVQNELRIYDQLPTLIPSRVMLLEGDRALECVLVNDQGNFQMVILRLNSAADGQVRITDLHWLGPALEISRRMRHMFILLGAPFAPGLNAEELDLRYEAQDARMDIQMALKALGAGDVETAYRRWSSVSSGLKASRIWADLRDVMAVRGSKRAQADILGAYQRDTLPNRLNRLNLAMQMKDQVAVRAAFDAMLETYYHPPFIFTVKAGYLVDSGAMEEGFALARRTYELNPFSSGAYAVAIQAACGTGQLDTALEVVRDWHAVTSADAIDQALRGIPRVQTLLKTAAYESWLRDNRAATPATPAMASPEGR